MKKFLIMAVLAALLVPSTVLASSIGVTINNTPINFTEQTGIPFIDDANRTLVPMRIVMEQYGCSVSWEQSTKTATVSKDDTTVVIPIGQSYILINGTNQNIDAPAQVINGKTYLPIRSVLEAVGAEVEWDNSSKSVVVEKNSNNESVIDTENKNTINEKENSNTLSYEEFKSNFEIEHVGPLFYI